MHSTLLPDHTAQLAQMADLNGLLTLALVQHQLGPAAREDGDLLEDWLRSRRITGAVRTSVKAAVAAGTTTDSGWAAPLAQPRPMVAAFLAAVDRESVLGQLNATKVPSTNVVGAQQTSRAVAYWVGQGVAKPISSLTYAATALPPLKVAANVSITEELVKLGSVDVIAMKQREVVSAVAIALDDSLLDPLNAGSANVEPASLTNGLVGLTPAGDFENQVGQVITALSGGNPRRPVLVVNWQSAARLAGLAGLRELREFGLKILITPAAGNRLIGIDAQGVSYVDDGGTEDIGTPDLQMDSAPTTPSTSATVMISAWQRNLRVIRAERWCNWARRSDAVAYLELA